MQDSYYVMREAREGEQPLRDGKVIAATAFLTVDLTTGRDKRWILNRIEVARGTEKGRGWGTELLQLIVEQADAEDVTLLLGVDPDDPRYFWKLVTWYRKHGFKPKKRGGKLDQVYNVMVRHPK